MYTLLFLLVSSSILLGVEAGLKAEYLNVKLPQRVYRSASYYDGDDTIFLIGGAIPGTWYPEYSNQLVKFSITNETVAVVKLLPDVVPEACVTDLRNGSIFIFGGWHDGKAACRYYPMINSYAKLPDFTDSVHGCSTAKLDANSTKAFIFDSNSVLDDTITKIWTYNMESPNVTVEVGTVPYYNIPAVAQIGSKVYFFGNSWPCCAGGRASVTKLDLETMDYVTTDEVLPKMSEPKVVYDSKGGKIYIIGGYHEDDERADGILQLDPFTMNYNFIPVENFLPGPQGHWTAPAVHYVEKLNRIYLFGGSLSNSGYSDDIRYIDLNNLDKLNIK